MQASSEIYLGRCRLLLGYAEQLHHCKQKLGNDDLPERITSETIRRQNN